jgi:hypothetical protein
MCPESSEDDPEVTLMIFVILGVDKDVVNETMTNLCSSSINTLFMRFMKKAGAFVSPKGITMNSYCSYQVTNAVL